ncbi:MAG TPA: ArgE/DapE family deacylase [Gaiellales bacterium]
MNDAEQRIADAIAGSRDELVELASELIRFDTTAREAGDPARDEAALQEHLAARLRAVGAEVEVWEPRPEDVRGTQVPFALDFDGRPQLLARFAGSGGGRSLLLNGHIDVVSGEPKERWTDDPNTPVVRDGNLYGRGACDMKGGVAAMVMAAETLARLGVRLAGDLLVNTITDEESTGAGGIASVAHGVRADAGIVPEPTAFDVWIACRGSVYPTITVEGRPGHAELLQPHWRDGGAVNAIEKAQIVLDAIGRLREEWRTRSDLQHPYLSPPDIVPTVMRAGEWSVTYPASCEITCAVLFPPALADDEGYGSRAMAAVRDAIGSACAADPWLAEHPPTFGWTADIPPMEIPPDDPIVQTMLAASAEVGEPSRLSGLDSWYDGATYTLSAGTPSIAFGPRSIAWGHTIDEYVPVDDLVRCAQAIALAAVRFCGTA